MARSKPVKFTLSGKDTNLPQAMCKRGWFEFHEYYSAKIEVDPDTGKGTIEFTKLGKEYEED
jgi:hypothetical protein